MKSLNYKVVYTVEQFASMGFEGEIAKFMREHPNASIIGETIGVDRCVVLNNSKKQTIKH